MVKGSLCDVKASGLKNLREYGGRKFQFN